MYVELYDIVSRCRYTTIEKMIAEVILIIVVLYVLYAQHCMHQVQDAPGML